MTTKVSAEMLKFAGVKKATPHPAIAAYAASIDKLIADTEQHARDGLITRREAARKIAELKAR